VAKKRDPRPSTELVAARLMGQASVALLPRLDGVTVEHQLAAEDLRAISLARTLTELGIADPSDWQHNASRYLLQTLQRWSGRHGGDAFREHFSLHATLRNNPAPYSNEDIDPQRLFLAVEADAAGYIVIGPTLEMLKDVHPQLPVTFYRLLMGAIGRCVRAYDYQDALERVEIWKEWIEQEENAEPYEVPDVEGCIPFAMKQEPLTSNELQDLMRSSKDQQARRLVEGALDLETISHRLEPPEVGEDSREPLMDCNPPLPALLVSFKRQDAIVAGFDEGRQAMLEVEPEPSFLAEIDPGDVASVREAFDLLAALCETLAAASRLMAHLPGNQDQES
jgi:hypothetical protein